MGSELEKILTKLHGGDEPSLPCYRCKEAATAIRELVMKCVPEAKEVRYVSGTKKMAHNGTLIEMTENISYDQAESQWNECRALTLERIKEL